MVRMSPKRKLATTESKSAPRQQTARERMTELHGQGLSEGTARKQMNDDGWKKSWVSKLFRRYWPQVVGSLPARAINEPRPSNEPDAVASMAAPSSVAKRSASASVTPRVSVGAGGAVRKANRAAAGRCRVAARDHLLACAGTACI